MKIIPFLFLSASLLHAAPSVDLGAEIQIPLESSNAFALVNKATGDVRLVTPVAGGDYTSATYTSGLSAVTGGTSGFNDGSNEFLMLASPTSNRLSRFNVSTGVSTPLFPEFPAPKFPVYVTKDPAADQRLLLSHTFNGSSAALSAYGNPTGNLVFQDASTSDSQITSFQPFFEEVTKPRFAAGVVTNGIKSLLFFFLNDSVANIDSIANVPNELTLTTNIRSEDDELIIAGHIAGGNEVYLYALPAVPDIDRGDFVSVPFAIGSIAPAPIGVGMKGVLITSADGSEAYHYKVIDVDQLELVQTFNAAGGEIIHGLVTIPGVGLMLLSGNDASMATRFDRMAWNGSEWKTMQSGPLSPIGIPASPDWATLFWFDAEPLVDTTARLLKLEVTPDWTSKGSPDPIPIKIFTESFISSLTGLDDPQAFAPSAPAGAQFVMANQFMESVSLSALGSTLELTLPPLSVSPESGSYATPVQISATTSEDAYTIFYRNATTGGDWEVFSSPLPVGYTSTWQFYAAKPNSGALSPIATRQFTFSTADLTQFDSDGDSVPDFVEIANGLNPNGGVDTDADGYSDLDELLNGSDPNSAASTPGSATTPFNGEGFKLFVQAKNHAGSVASDGNPAPQDNLDDGVPIDLRGMTSNLLASEPTEKLIAPAAPAVLVNQLAATFQLRTPVPAREWLVLNTPQDFDVKGGTLGTRSGREIFKILQRPVQDPPAIAPALTGTDIDADAASWLAAATLAYNSYVQVTSLTALVPADTAAAVIAEAAIYDALLNLTPAQQSSFNVPQDAPPVFGYDLFTLFGGRVNDTRRTSLTPAMRDALLYDGLSFSNLLTALNVSVDASPDLLALTTEIYAFRVAHSLPTASAANVIPLLPLPLDVLRILVRGGDLPADYAPATTPARVTAAKAEMSSALATLASAYRPIETWTVEVIAPTTADEKYSYRKSFDSHLAAFYEPDGDRYTLDQGLGLATGTRFSVTGYTDVQAPSGYDGMELISLNVLFIPLASDTDADANLLADDWEKFFFGSTGAVDPFGKHPVNGYSYLQLYLLGADPRDDAAPTESAVVLFPGESSTIQLASGNFAIKFKFPDAYVDFFEFIVQESASLGVFSDYPSASRVTKIGPNTYQIDVGPAAPGTLKNFFRLYMRLKN